MCRCDEPPPCPKVNLNCDPAHDRFQSAWLARTELPRPASAGAEPAGHVRLGYARASTARQSLDAQLDSLAEARGDPRLLGEISTRATKRPELEAAVKLAGEIRCPGVAVTLVVHEHKRLGRGIELAMLAEELKASDVWLEFLTGELKDSHDPSGVVFTVLAAMSGMEREYIRDRTLEGHKSARKRGRTIGDAGVTDNDMLSMALHLRDIAKRLVITTGTKKGQHPSRAAVMRSPVSSSRSVSRSASSRGPPPGCSSRPSSRLISTSAAAWTWSCCQPESCTHSPATGPSATCRAGRAGRPTLRCCRALSQPTALGRPPAPVPAARYLPRSSTGDSFGCSPRSESSSAIGGTEPAAASSSSVAWSSRTHTRSGRWPSPPRSSSHPRGKGVSRTGRSPVDRGRTGSKHHLVTDATGIPLAVTPTGGNRPDVVLADRGYDHDKYRRPVRDLGMKPLIARRGIDHGSGLGTQRWVVERAFARLHWFRRLRIRWEIRDDISP